jgi:hypothetical protein
MDRVGLPTAVRSSARPRHHLSMGVRHMPSSSRSPNEIWMAIPRPRPRHEQPARNIVLFVASAVLAQPRHSHAFLPSAVPGSHRERLLKGIHAIDQNHFYSGQPWSISRLLADTHGPS